MGNSNLALTLWANPMRSRFFLVPDEHPLPPGDFVLRTITGREQRVNSAALVPFEVSEEQAKEWLKDEFGKMLDSARGAVNRFVEKLRSGPEKPGRIADLCALLDRIETILNLIVAEGGSDGTAGGTTAKDIETIAERVGGIAARLRQISESFRGTGGA
jgi:hypothetical protein